MAGLLPTLINGSFQNWLKAALGILFAKEGLTDFVSTEFTQFQTDLLQSVWTSCGIPAGTTCNFCTTFNLLKCPTQGFCNAGHCKIHDPAVPEKAPNQPCPNGICNTLMTAIRKNHRFNRPSWKNSDARRWCSDPFELAKCFLPPDGYSDIRSFGETDFNGIISVIINNKRFQSKLVAQLNTEPNICTQAREIGKTMRHSPDLLLTDADLAQYITDLITLLSDQKQIASDPKSQEAVNKLTELQTNTLTIHSNDITTVIRENIGDSICKQHKDVLKEINNHVCTVKSASLAAINKIIKVKLTALGIVTERGKADINLHTAKKKQGINLYASQKKQDINLHADQMKQGIAVFADQKKQDIDVHAEQKKHDLSIYTDEMKQEIAELGSKEFKNGSQLNEIKEEDYKGLQSELIKMYRKYSSMIPLSPIAVENDVPLVELYVEPPMSAIDSKLWHCDQLGNPVKSPVNNYTDLFSCKSKNKNTFSSIYITANAGVGKTSFSNYLCMTWCQTHDPDKTLSHHFRTENLQALKLFDFVFLISLRQVPKSMCHVENFIYEVLQDRLPGLKNSRKLVDAVLNCKSCLIILDGLDEWVHPKCERSEKKSDIPHAKCWGGCTIVTTSRPWKLDVIRLPSIEVDRHVEICQLNNFSSRRLVNNAIKVLNDKSNKPKTTIDDFDQATSGLNLVNLIYTPYINLQIVTLWHDGENIGRSTCEIFTNIVDLTIDRGLAKNGPGPISAVTHISCKKPKCFKLRGHCHKYFSLLYNLGKLAFYALFGMEQESLLIIEKEVALEYIKSKEELEFCLKLGLLSQNKDYRYVSRRQSQVSFQHKTFQEYFAALYIQSGKEGENAHEIILKKCINLDSVLEMSVMFVFLSGINPVVYNRTFLNISNILSTDKTVSSYRTNPIFKVQCEKMFAFQTLQKDCMQEIKINEQFGCVPLVEDVIINQASKKEVYLTSLETIVRYHCDRIKSIFITEVDATECTEIVQRLNIRLFCNLDMLCLWCSMGLVDLEHLLENNLKSLRFIEILNVKFEENKHMDTMTSFSRKCLYAITNMPSLQDLTLCNVYMKHNELKNMFDFITNHGIMTSIKLLHIQCEDHGDSCTGLMLDLSRHANITSLYLHKVHIHHLHVNTERLKECLIGLLPTGVASFWLKEITANPIIHGLLCDSIAGEDLSTLIEILPTLLHFKALRIFSISLGDLQLPISPNMNSLAYIQFVNVSMSCSVLRKLVDTVIHLIQTVTVDLNGCKVTPDEEYKSIMLEIKTSKKFRVTFDGINRDKKEQFTFQTLKANEN